MILVGDEIYNPVTGTRFHIRAMSETGFTIEQTVEPHKKPSTLNHMHKTWTENFEVISGTGKYSLNGKVTEIRAGDTFTVNAGQAHIHPWNIGNDILHFRQTDTFPTPDPTAAQDTFLGFSTTFALAGLGRADHDGVPRNPLQLMATLDFFRQHGGYIPGAPIGLQDVLMRGGGALARAFGYRGWYEEYLPKRG
jgi:mannose-6-phosphate isomerase-like protein (cupin superfamily)